MQPFLCTGHNSTAFLLTAPKVRKRLRGHPFCSNISVYTESFDPLAEFILDESVTKPTTGGMIDDRWI